MIDNFDITETENCGGKIMVKKATEFNLDELNLSKRTYNCVKNIPPEELVLSIRNDHLRIKGMWQTCHDELYNAVDKAGFIRHDLDSRSFGLAKLCKELGVSFSFGGRVMYIERVYGFFESNNDYENYQNFTNQQIDEAILLIEEKLNLVEADFVKYRFGLNNEPYPADILKIHRRLSMYDILRKLKTPAVRNRLKCIVCIPSEKECRTGLYAIIKEMAELYEDPALKRERELRRELSMVSQNTLFESARHLGDFMDRHFSLPFEVIGLQELNYAGFINLTNKGIRTVGDFVMFCYKYPKDWYTRGLNLENIRQVLTIIGRTANLGCVLPLADMFRSRKFRIPLKRIGLKPETLSGLEHVCFAKYDVVGDIVMLWHRSPGGWFSGDAIISPEMSWQCYKDLVDKMVSLGYEIPLFDGMEALADDHEGLPSFEDLHLKSSLVSNLRRANINSMEELYHFCLEHPDDWPIKSYCGTNGAIEIIVKMAALGSVVLIRL